MCGGKCTIQFQQLPLKLLIKEVICCHLVEVARYLLCTDKVTDLFHWLHFR